MFGWWISEAVTGKGGGWSSWVYGSCGLNVYHASLTHIWNTSNVEQTPRAIVFSVLLEVSKTRFVRIDCDDALCYCEQIESFEQNWGSVTDIWSKIVYLKIVLVVVKNTLYGLDSNEAKIKEHLLQDRNLAKVVSKIRRLKIFYQQSFHRNSNRQCRPDFSKMGCGFYYGLYCKSEKRDFVHYINNSQPIYWFCHAQ